MVRSFLRRWNHSHLALSLVIGFFATTVNGQGKTTCSNTNTNWYSNVVGESPCTTYERLRQICNADYRVGTLTPNTPPDHCDDQLSDCCCNSISFGLSMLCLACQDSSANGFDAGVGAYQDYLIHSSGVGSCGAGTNKSLPASIQTAVCNQKIKIEDDLYGLFWGDGAWQVLVSVHASFPFRPSVSNSSPPSAFARDTITKNQIASNNNTFTHCQSTLNNLTSTSTAMSSTSTPSATSTPSPPAKSTLGTGAIAGIAIGGVALAVLVAALLFAFRRRRRAHARPMSFDSIDAFDASTTEPKRNGGGTTSASGTSYFPSTYPVPPSAMTVEPLEWEPSHDMGQSPPPPLPRGASNKAAMATAESQLRWAEQNRTANNNDAGTGSSTRGLPHNRNPSSASLLSPSSEPERHRDAGPMLGRSPSGRLPPAYGDFEEQAAGDAQPLSDEDQSRLDEEEGPVGGDSASGSASGRWRRGGGSVGDQQSSRGGGSSVSRGASTRKS